MLNYLRDTSDVDSFDWRYRHGENYWITPVKNQYSTDLCSIFAAVGLTEAIANLYYNTNLNLNLSEEDIATYIQLLYPNDTANWHREQNVIGYICSQGVIDEYSLPFSYQTYPSPSTPRPEGIELIKGNAVLNVSGSLSEEKVKKAIISRPYISGFYLGGGGHEMLLVGFNKVKSGYYWNDPYFSDILIPSGSPLIGQTYWIFKNSWGTDIGNNAGYAYVIFHDYSHMRTPYSLGTPLQSRVNRSVVCEDRDGDGLFNWGIGSRPSSIPIWLKEDADDSNSNLGWIDTYGHIANINPDDSNVWTLPQDSILTKNQYIYNHIQIPSQRTFTIACHVIMNKNTEIRVASGATLIIDGGVIQNGIIKPVSGSSIIINNGGKIILNTDGNFILPNGALLQINEGEIKNIS